VGVSQTPWVVISEIIPLRLRSTAVSLAGASNWIANFIVTTVFLPIVNTQLGLVLIWLCLAAASLAMWFWVYFRLPETK